MDKQHAAMIGEPDRAYCGRRGQKTTTAWSKVTCEDCRAAYRADGGKP